MVPVVIFLAFELFAEEEEPLDGPLTPVQDALEHIKAQRDKGFLQEKFIDSFKGLWNLSVDYGAVTGS